MTYIAIAYRYGWSNGHWYIVHAGPNRRAIIDAANAEHAVGGGKYGIQVVEIDDDGEEKPIGYFSSSYNEEKPRLCVVQEVCEKVGSEVLRAISDGAPLTVDEIVTLEQKELKLQKVIAGGAE